MGSVHSSIISDCELVLSVTRPEKQISHHRRVAHDCALLIMATSATSLLAEFDFNLTSRATSPRILHQPQRPPTPDPRRTPTPHPPRPLFHSSSTPATSNNKRRLRKKPTAIFVGNEASGPTPAQQRWLSEENSRTDAPASPERTLPSLLPFHPTTPSPRFATSPSLSSGGTTVQSSPTATPTTPYFGSSYSEPRQSAKRFDTFDSWDNTEGRFGLRRAKRLPHREQGLWEVHAVVHVSESGKDSGSGERIEQQQQNRHYEWCNQQQQQAGFLGFEPPRQPIVSATTQAPSRPERLPLNRKEAAVCAPGPTGLYDIHSESDRSEARLRKPQAADSSSYSLSKYHFPAPPGDYRIGLSGKYVPRRPANILH